MNFEILKFSDKTALARWKSVWKSWTDREIYAHPDYAKLFCKANDLPIATYCRTNNGGILFPFILRGLSGEEWVSGSDQFFDVISPYGYGGAFSWGDGREYETEFWKEYENWARSSSVVTSFVRLSLFPEQRLSHQGKIESPYKNIVRSLDLDKDALWYDYKHAIRKNVKRARASGVRIRVDDSGQYLEEFLCIYFSTMDRVGAESNYYFEREFFHTLVAKLKGNYMFFHADVGGKIISTELVLISSNNIYSFLGGTDPSFTNMRPNNLLKHEIIKWGIDCGKKYYVLGGGYKKDDGIFKYKQAFAPTGGRAFMTSKSVHNRLRFAELRSMRKIWESGQGREWHPAPGFFPAYRA